MRRVVQQRANELRRLSCEETIPNRALAEMMRCERRPALGALTDWKENERQGKTWLASQRPAGNGLVTGQSRFQDGVIHQDKGEGHRRRPSPQFRLAT